MFRFFFVFFFKQKTAYEMRISDWSSDVCSSDLNFRSPFGHLSIALCATNIAKKKLRNGSVAKIVKLEHAWRRLDGRNDDGFQVAPFPGSSEEHTSELQPLMRLSYAVFCLKKQICQLNNSTNQAPRLI